MLGEKRYLDARAILLDLAKSASDARVESAYLWFMLGIASDYLNEPVSATDCFAKALAADPLSIPFRHTWGIVIRRVRGTLHGEDCPPETRGEPLRPHSQAR